MRICSIERHPTSSSFGLATTYNLTPAVRLQAVKRLGDAQFAYCSECDYWLGCPYWSLGKSVGLHKHGTGHKPTLLAFNV